MSPVKTLKTIPVEVWIPSTAKTYSKIIITASDDTDYTVLDTYSGADADNWCISSSITRPVTDKLGNFSLRISNQNGTFQGKFDGGEILNIYSDNTDATTRIFRGKIDNVSYGVDLTVGFFVDINGRDYPELVDKTITGIEVASTGDVALAGILNEFYSDITLTFWNGSSWSTATYNSGNDTVSWDPAVSTFPTDTLNMTYQHKKGWATIGEICKRIGLDCYIEYVTSSWVLRTFIQEEITNTDCNVAYGVNLITLSDFGTDTTDIINRAIIYGKTESDNILLLKTEENTASQSDLWIKDRILNEGSLSTMDDVQDKADYELSEGVDVSDSGRVNTVILTSLKPGNIINVSVKFCNVEGEYKVHQFSHNFNNNTTSIQLTSKQKTISDLFISKVNPEEFIGSISNPNNMKDSYTVYFNEDPTVITHVNTEETDGKLRLQDGQSSGNIIADTITTDYNVTSCELRRYENFETENDDYYVSADGGISWESYVASVGDIHTFGTTGNQLTFKIELNRTDAGSTSPAYESVCLLIK